MLRLWVDLPLTGGFGDPLLLSRSQRIFPATFALLHLVLATAASLAFAAADVCLFGPAPLVRQLA